MDTFGWNVLKENTWINHNNEWNSTGLPLFFQFLHPLKPDAPSDCFEHTFLSAFELFLTLQIMQLNDAKRTISKRNRQFILSKSKRGVKELIKQTNKQTNSQKQDLIWSCSSGQLFSLVSKLLFLTWNVVESLTFWAATRSENRWIVLCCWCNCSNGGSEEMQVVMQKEV